MADRDHEKGPKTASPVDPDTAKARQKLIGDRLKDLYNDVLDEGVPDEFEALLDQLDQKAAKTSTNENGEPEGSTQSGGSN